MIKSIKEKEIYELQIKRLETALLDIKEKTIDNPSLYKVLSQPYKNKIRTLRNEIDIFLEIDQIDDFTDLVVRIQGQTIGSGKAPMSVVTNTLKNVRSAISNLYGLLAGVTDLQNLPKHIVDACDFSFVGTAEGSIKLLLDIPTNEASLISKIELEPVITLLFRAAEWAQNEQGLHEIEEIMPIKKHREILLKHLLKLTPTTDDKRIESIQYYGQKISNKVTLTNATRNHIKNFIEIEKESVTINGVVREIDLDKRTFILRETKLENLNEVKCKLGNSSLELPELNSIITIKAFEKSLKNKILNVVVIDYLECNK